MISRRLPLAAAALAVAAILVATLVPTRTVATEDLHRIASEPWPLADFLRNVILFAPLGASLAWLGGSARSSMLAGGALSALIELVQIAIPGRDPSPIDWIANVAGLALGLGAFRSAPAWLQPTPARAKWLALTAGGAAAGLLWSTGVLLAPAPSSAIFFGHRTPTLPHLAHYGGSVLGASIDELEIPYVGEIRDSESMRARLRGDYTLRVDALASNPPDDLAAFVLVTDAEQREILLLGPDHDDLVFRFRSRSYEVGLETASVRLPHALRDVGPGDRVSLGVQRIGGDLRFSVDGMLDRGHGFTVGDAWLLLAPDFRVVAAWRTVLEATWMAALFLPLGYWGRRDTASVVAWGLAVTALFLAPVVTELRPTPGLQFAGAGFGAALGTLSRRHLPERPRHPGCKG